MKSLWPTISFCLILASACTLEKQTNEDIVASAFGNRLYHSDLDELRTASLSQADSSSIIKKYVDNWLMQEILYNEAKNKVGVEKNIDRLVERYKKSLYIHELEKLQLAELLDTTISSAALDTFYSQHKKDFLLDEGITKLLFVKVPESMDNEKLKILWKTENIPALKVFVQAVDGIQLLELDQWHYISEINNLSPTALLDKVNFSKRESYSLTQDGSKFLIKILDYVKPNEIAPKSFAIDKIKLRMLHDRSTNLLNKWKKDLYQNNIQSKNIIIN